jgi:Zinc carboxypeptidase
MSLPRLVRAGAVLALAVVLAAPAFAESQPQDEDFAKSVREWTTQPEFLTPLVDHLPKVAGLPEPKDVLGYHVGAPRLLTKYEDLLRYYRALEAKSPRVKVLSIGKTDEGREQVVVYVSSEDTIKGLEREREDLARLADPRGLGDAQAQAIIERAKPIYHLMGGLHSAETGPPEMLMELAYRLAADESPLYRRIRESLIVTITPAAEPDGRDRYVDWYRLYRVDETDENETSGGPPYWGKYILHDNNRDINYSQVTMRHLLEWYLRWHPPIMHDLHESVPFLYTFSGQAPQNPTLDPIAYAEMPWFANFEMAQLTKYGLPGVWTHAFVDMWSPGYLAFMSSNHNGLIRMYETFGNGGATTMKRRVAPRPGEGRGMDATKREWYRPLPALKEVTWSMRNNTNYMETAVLSALDLASSYPKLILDNFYRKSRNSIESGRTEAPYGFVIPAGQRDGTRVAELVNLLRVQGIEVGRAKTEIKLKDASFPKGSYVVKRDQPYGRLAKILLEKQSFPDASLRTYDDTAWTMGLMLHADVKPIADKAILDAAVDPVDVAKAEGSFSHASAPSVYAVAHFGSNAMVTLRERLKGLRVRAAEKAFKAGDLEYPAGSFLIPADQAGAGDVAGAVAALGLTGAALAASPDVPTHELDLPRLAVYSTWGSTQEVGWVRHAFDHFEVAYDLVFKERVRKGGLRADYDVIVIPNQGRGSARSLVFDVPFRGKHLAYLKSPEHPSLGMYGESDDITGGMGLEGVIELRRFVEEGGVLVTLGPSSYFPPEFGLTLRVDASRPSPQFYAPGPIVEAEIARPEHPIFYGYPEKKVAVRYANGPLLRVPENDKGEILMTYVGDEAGVLSGLMKDPKEIKGRPAILDVPEGKGRVLLFATNPCYRWQNHGEFNMLFGALLNWNDFPKPAPPAEKE